jgi:uncharacterized glyoxalase superfamily protein PhnB
MTEPAQRAFPMLSYEDVRAAADWISEAFGAEDLEGHRWMFVQAV